jgi:hydroxysqualene synthase
VSVDHYENFPVASWLCPPALRPPITAIYHFARTADDLADEGDAPVAQRLADLQAYRVELARVAAGQAAQPRWFAVFAPLAHAITAHRLPVALLDDLLDAFIQDTGNPLYETREQLLDYCRRSANPVGRLLLHLYGVTDARALARSDAICTALQLINFWQDFSVDHPRGRCYLPLADCRRHGVDRLALLAGAAPPPSGQALLGDLLDWTEALMHEGAPLVHHVPGRAGWELRAVVQGGLRILEKIRRMNPASFVQRPRLRAADGPLLLWRAALMRQVAR